MAKTYLRLPAGPGCWEIFSSRAHTQSGCTPPQPDNIIMVGVAEKKFANNVRAWALELEGFSGVRDNQPINCAKN
jgi:hypothetical protein